MYIRRVFPITFCAVIAIVLFMNVALDITKQVSLLRFEESEYLLIDPGHGGADGGTVSADGALEDDINLAISLTLRDLLTFCGYSVKMTRTEDVSVRHVYDKNRSWKVNDMYSRLEMYDKASLTLSIHQNHFSQSQYFGAQIFYSANRPESRDVAECVRRQIISLLQPQNARELKAAGENIFLLHRTQKPALIVECGFLSNPAEAEKLQDSDYQRQMAFSICCGILEYAL